jgi:hypothetical protein
MPDMKTRTSQLLNAIEFGCHCCRSGSGIQCFFDPWIRNPDPGYKIEKNGSGINILDYISESLVTNFWVKNMQILCQISFADPATGSGAFSTLNPGGKKYGYEIYIQDPQH